MASSNKIRLTFTDGRTIDIAVTPKSLVASERKWGSELGQHQIESGFYMAWVAIGMPGGPDAFDGWLDTVEQAEPIEDPTDAVTPSEPSPPSPLSPA